jgi:Fe-S cluster assembly protein SufD
MTTVADKSVNSYRDDFARWMENLPGSGLPWLREIRQESIERFVALGFPTLRDEAWRFTPLAPLTKVNFQSVDRSSTPRPTYQDLQAISFPGLERFQLVFLNGHFTPELSTIPQDLNGTQVGSLADLLQSKSVDVQPHLSRYADTRTQTFTALNTAMFQDGAYIRLPKGTTLDIPIHLLLVSTSGGPPMVSYPRILIVAEQDSRASVIEHYSGWDGAPTWTNAVTEVVLGENARLDHYKLERESPEAFHISTLQVQQARNSQLVSNAILLGGALARNNINVVLAAEGAECELNGFYIATGEQLLDSHTLIDHAKPHGTSREYYKGILDQRSHGVFDGHIIVRPDAQKTDAIQTNKNLLLSSDALVNTKPELKIFANDVKCKHGATVGQISADALFYLRSRGISESEARRVLIAGFANEMLDRIAIPTVRAGLDRQLFEATHV